MDLKGSIASSSSSSVSVSLSSAKSRREQEREEDEEGWFAVVVFLVYVHLLYQKRSIRDILEKRQRRVSLDRRTAR